MNTELLLQHFKRLSESPDAIPRLRRFILDLAVRGKLLEQDSNEEPAAELLKRIQAEKARLVKAGKAAKQDPFEVPSQTDVPFPIHQSWAWVAATYPAYLISDLGKKIQTKDVLESGAFPVVDQGKVFIRGYCNDETKVIHIKAPIVLFGDHTRETKLIDFDFVVGADGVKLLQPVGLLTDYYYLALQWLPLDSRGYGRHFKLLRAAFLPLPPLAEQHRIVTKVDELMTLCDQLEVAKADREQSRDRLVAASLQRLNQPANTEEAYSDDVRFTFNHLPRLTTRPVHIKQLRQTILNLAVRGKLVSQDSNDEPAKALLEEIKSENYRLQQEKGIRSQKPAEPNKTYEGSVAIPNNWVHAYLQDLAYQITDGTHLTPKYTEEGKPFLSAQNIKPFRFMPEKYRLVSVADFENYRANRKPECGDVLLTRVGAGIGEAAVLDSDFEFAFYVSLCLIKIPTRLLNQDYLVLWLNSPEGRESSTARTYGKGASQGNLNLGLIRTFKIPLPPLAEQRRIVAKVDELMALCDQLEAQLSTTETDSRRLLEAVLNEALAPALEEAA